MEKFLENLRAYLEAARIDEWSKESSKRLRKLYDSIPVEVDFAEFMDVFIARPTWSIDAAVEYCEEWMQEQLAFA